MDEAKPLIKSNQLENPIPSNKIGSSAASFSTYVLPPRLDMWVMLCVCKKTDPWGWYYLKTSQRKQYKKYQRRKRYCFAEYAAGEDEESGEG